jgi:hypothetical protein
MSATVDGVECHDKAMPLVDDQSVKQEHSVASVSACELNVHR